MPAAPRKMRATHPRSRAKASARPGREAKAKKWRVMHEGSLKKAVPQEHGEADGRVEEQASRP